MDPAKKRMGSGVLEGAETKAPKIGKDRE